MEKQVKAILDSMSNIKRPQKLFLALLFRALMTFQGKANFRNLSRYSDISEKRLSRWFRRDFDFALFNRKLLSLVQPSDQTRIAAIDASFMSKSGKKTEGLGWFYNGSAGEAKRGLEISVVCVIDLQQNTAYALEARQTIDQEGKTRIDLYAEQIEDLESQLHYQQIQYIVADALYSKTKFVYRVVNAGFDLVGKLRVDADLQWIYEGGYCGVGRPREFDGKVDFEKDLDRFKLEGTLENGVSVYSGVVHSKSLKRKIKVVMLIQSAGGKTARSLLFSTDTELDAMTLISYYKARFQIEFLFRDAKQHSGLAHCQSRSKKAIHTQINASLVALNLLKMEDQRVKQTNDQTVISIVSWKRRKSNQHLMKILFKKLGLSIKAQKVASVYEYMSDYGAIAS